MIKPVAFLAMLLIKMSEAMLYIDLKLNYMLQGIVVHHGYLQTGGKYKMFIGEKEPIQKVGFGVIRIFPVRDEPPKKTKYQLIVELFETKKRRFVILHIYTFRNDQYTGYTREFYELGSDTFVQASQESLLYTLETTVHISMDIAPKNMHPFILQTVEETATVKTLTYTIAEEFNSVKLDGVSAPKYTFGSVYDSGTPIVVGYTKMPVFQRGCKVVKVDHKSYPDRVTLEGEEFSLVFEKRMILNSHIWYLVLRADPTHMYPPFNQALRIFDRIETAPERFSLLTLDISENITSELYGIEKTEGTVGPWTYILYEVKKNSDGQQSIRSIIDMSTINVKIHIIEEHGIKVTVESFSNELERILLVSMFKKEGLSRTADLEMYRKKHNNEASYTTVLEPEKSIILTDLRKLYPIKLKVNLWEESTAIYDKIDVGSDSFLFHHYYLRESDRNGNDIRHKYVFGTLMERNPYEQGNMPCEDFIRNMRVVNDQISTRKFMVRNTYTGVPINASVYEIYPLMM